jgi:hypothetical protein
VLEIIIAQLATALLIIYFVNKKLKVVVDYLYSIEGRLLLVQAELKSLSEKIES